MEFPPTWDFMTPCDAATFGFAPNQPLAMATLLDFNGGAIGAFRIILGGTQLVEVSFCAALLFGAEFDGKPFPPLYFQLFKSVFIALFGRRRHPGLFTFSPSGLNSM